MPTKKRAAVEDEEDLSRQGSLAPTNKRARTSSGEVNGHMKGKRKGKAKAVDNSRMDDDEDDDEDDEILNTKKETKSTGGGWLSKLSSLAGNKVILQEFSSIFKSNFNFF